jgi:hypothetical protein
LNHDSAGRTAWWPALPPYTLPRAVTLKITSMVSSIVSRAYWIRALISMPM